MTTDLTAVPSLAIFPDAGGNVTKINFYDGSIDIEQEGNIVNIEDDVLEEFIKALRKGRKEADLHLKSKKS